MVILHPDQIIDEHHIDPIYKQKKITTVPKTSPLTTDTPFNIKEYIAHIEQQLIKMALEKSNGVINAAAKYLSLGKTTLMEKMKKYNLT
jgi:DNA-binding NtrC family response regulator